MGWGLLASVAQPGAGRLVWAGLGLSTPSFRLGVGHLASQDRKLLLPARRSLPGAQVRRGLTPDFSSSASFRCPQGAKLREWVAPWRERPWNAMLIPL
jgi:hypothetical protein